MPTIIKEPSKKGKSSCAVIRCPVMRERNNPDDTTYCDPISHSQKFWIKFTFPPLKNDT